MIIKRIAMYALAGSVSTVSAILTSEGYKMIRENCPLKDKMEEDIKAKRKQRFDNIISQTNLKEGLA